MKNDFRVTKFNEYGANINILSVKDPITKKNYNIHIKTSIANMGPLEGYLCSEIYLTDSNPDHDILVNIGRKAFAVEDFSTADEKFNELIKIAKANLADGIKLFETIVATCIEKS